MKKKIIASLFSVIASCILYGNLNAQRVMRGVEATSDVITVNNASVRISNLFILDSLGQHEPGSSRAYDNPIVHLAAFEIELGSPEATTMLKTLHAAIGGQPLSGFTLQKLNLQRQVIEERNFSMVAVKEIHFPELNVASMEAAKATVIVQADDVVYYDNPGGRVSTYAEKRSKIAAGNKFRLVMGNLPTQNISRISKIKRAYSSKQEYMHFSVDITSADAKQWRDWFKTGAGGLQTKDAVISLMDLSTMQEVLTYQLSQVEIISVSVTTKVEGISITTIGLRTRQVPAIN